MQNIIQIYENEMGVVAVYMIHNFLHHRFSCKTCPLTFYFIFAFISILKKKYDLLFIHVLIDMFSSMLFLQTGNLYFVPNKYFEFETLYTIFSCFSYTPGGKNKKIKYFLFTFCSNNYY